MSMWSLFIPSGITHTHLQTHLHGALITHSMRTLCMSQMMWRCRGHAFLQGYWILAPRLHFIVQGFASFYYQCEREKAKQGKAGIHPDHTKEV